MKKTAVLLSALLALSSCAENYSRYDSSPPPHAASSPAAAAGVNAWGQDSPRRVYYYPAPRPAAVLGK